MKQEKNYKKQKFEEKIIQELSSFLRRGLADSRLQFISFTKADLSSDLATGIVYWDSFDPSRKPEIMDALEKARGRIRSHLAGVLNVRHMPDLSFAYDAQYEEERHIEGLLKAEKDEGRDF